MTASAIAAHRAGLMVCIEGVGDRGIDFALDAIEAALAAHPVADHRMRVEHCCYVTPPILARLKRLQVVDSSATGFMYDLGDAYIANRGAEAMRRMWPHRSLIDAGVPAPGHSDARCASRAPGSPCGRWSTARAARAIPRPGRSHNPARGAARLYHPRRLFRARGAIKGPLEPGKLADLVVLDRDLLSGDPEEIRAIQPLMTFVGGELRYEA